jgi:hypothetical protein
MSKKPEPTLSEKIQKIHTLGDNATARAAHPTGSSTKPGSVNIGGGPKIRPKVEQPKPSAGGADQGGPAGTKAP